MEEQLKQAAARFLDQGFLQPNQTRDIMWTTIVVHRSHGVLVQPDLAKLREIATLIVEKVNENGMINVDGRPHRCRVYISKDGSGQPCEVIVSDLV